MRSSEDLATLLLTRKPVAEAATASDSRVFPADRFGTVARSATLEEEIPVAEAATLPIRASPRPIGRNGGPFRYA